MREELSEILGNNQNEGEEQASRDLQVGGGYARNVQFRSLIRSGEEDPQPRDMVSSYSQGRATFGRAKLSSPKNEHPSKYLRNGGSSDDERADEAGYQDYINDYSMLSKN